MVRSMQYNSLPRLTQLGQRHAAAVPGRLALVPGEQRQHAVANVGGGGRGQARADAAHALGRRPAHHRVLVAQGAQQQLYYFLHLHRMTKSNYFHMYKYLSKHTQKYRC